MPSNTPYSLRNKAALITGASRGIGRAVAKRFAAEGCDVALAARSPEALEETARLCREAGAKAIALPCDLSDTEALANVVSGAVEALGRLDHLVNNAGVMHRGKCGELELAKFDQMMDLNLRTLAHLTHHALPHLKAQARSSVINISSIAGHMTFGGGAGYCASKHAVQGYTGALFDDVREAGIKVSAICPGFVRTDMATSDALDPEKMIQPEDIAETVCFVATFPEAGCPTEIVLRPQRSPYL